MNNVGYSGGKQSTALTRAIYAACTELTRFHFSAEELTSSLTGRLQIECGWNHSSRRSVCCFNLGFMNRSDWSRESLHLSSHLQSGKWAPQSCLEKMRNPGQWTTSLPSHTDINTATCSRDRKKAKRSHACQMKAMCNVFMWEKLEAVVERAPLCITYESWENAAPLYSPHKPLPPTLLPPHTCSIAVLCSWVNLHIHTHARTDA